MHGLRLQWDAVIGWDPLPTGEQFIPDQDEVSDLIVVIIDELDDLGIEPDVFTSLEGPDLHIQIAAEFAFAGNALDAMEQLIVKVKAAFHAAGIGTASVDPSVIRRATQPPVIRSLRHGELTTV